MTRFGENIEKMCLFFLSTLLNLVGCGVAERDGEPVNNTRRRLKQEPSKLILAFDFTKTPAEGVHSQLVPIVLSTNTRSAHHVRETTPNEYEKITDAIGILCDPGERIHCLGFGDCKSCRLGEVFNFSNTMSEYTGFEEVKRRYRELARGIYSAEERLLAPAINMAISLTNHRGCAGCKKHILVIICDSLKMSRSAEEATKVALSNARKFALTVLTIVVGDECRKRIKRFRTYNDSVNTFMVVDYKRIMSQPEPMERNEQKFISEVQKIMHSQAKNKEKFLSYIDSRIQRLSPQKPPPLQDNEETVSISEGWS